MTNTKPALVVLAGGASSRMWPLREKSLIRFGSQTLLERQLDSLAGVGFEQAVIVTNPGNHDAVAELTAAVAGMTVQLATQAEPKGMGDALLQTRAAVEALNANAVYVTQVHDVVELALHHNILSAYAADPTQSYIAGYKVASYFPGGYLVVDAGGRITDVHEKPGAGNEPSDLVNLVAHLHQDAPALYNAIEAEYASDTHTDDHYERAMAGLMQQSVYQAVVHNGHWSALKYPWHVLDVMNFFLDQIEGQHISENAFVADTAKLFGNVYIGENVKIFPGATVAGPAYIGAGTVIGNGALVRNSMVLDGCEVGFTTEVARSYVAPDCHMHACRVLDSVFATGVNFSAGCTTANLRIDKGIVKSTVKGNRMLTGRDKLGAIVGRDAFISVDAMTMPGVKLGERSVVGPTTNVEADLPDDKRIYVKQEHIITDA
jgi:UDP-N-acetylglucosamine diphosphorylase / glucose-1-phosphate thymidylyltransferase / UDP-N-acetylgalactosamine diphosphorylase / glucosamine-1-phosphate N-acetyltransferase / galactosamine-1-phosphate N-acetyltransferase